jgi:alkylation response protein AidB-like acyl-CoA dehydrogenase
MDHVIELSELQDAVQRAFPADKLASPRDSAWSLVAEQGWLMITLPEDLGGLGLGHEAAVAIHFELGRVLSTAPLIPALLALEGIAASTSLADQAGWIERICGGEYVPLNMLPGTVEESGGKLSGRLSGFFEADMAGHVLAGIAGKYLMIPTDAAGVTLSKRSLWDESRNLFDIELAGYAPDPALLVAGGEAAKALHDRISPLAQLAIAADSLGGANAALDMTVEYLKTRRQFDRPIAMFQALKHRCADLKTRIAAAEALLWQRAANLDASITDLGVTKALANDCYLETTEEAIQLHGGIGLTHEHNCHLFMKRAMLNAQLSGGGDHWREAAGRQALAQYAAV